MPEGYEKFENLGISIPDDKYELSDIVINTDKMITAMPYEMEGRTLTVLDLEGIDESVLINMPFVRFLEYLGL
jgi:hypothetical protein